MRKRVFDVGYWVLVVLFFTGCATQRVSKRPGEHMELGWVERTVLQTPQYVWFDSGYAAYNPTLEMLEDIQTKLDSVQILVVFGTWCSDSKREVPRFFKIVDGLQIPRDHIKLYAVDRSKQYPEGIPQEYQIERVPTIILKRGDQELGRIEESPKMTLELDLLDILLR